MKRILIAYAALAAVLATGAFAVTNTAKSIDSRSLPADVFRVVVNDRLYDVVNTDIPALVAALNATADGTSPGSFQKVTVTSNIVYGTTLSGNTASFTGVVTFAAAPATSIALGAIPTNTAAGSYTFTINGTNYIVPAYKN